MVTGSGGGRRPRAVEDARGPRRPSLGALSLLGVALGACAHADGPAPPGVLSPPGFASPAPAASGDAAPAIIQPPSLRPFDFALAPMLVVPGQGGANRVEVSFLDATLLVHTSTDRHGVPANGMIAVGDRGLTLIDTGWTAEETEAILSWGQRRLARPWIGAVITHDHADRDGGLEALLRRQIPIGALDLTVAKLDGRGIRGVVPLLAAGAAPVTDERGFEVFYPGPGHAADNIVIAWPDRRVVFGGCLLKAADAPDLGFAGDADLNLWPEAVRRVAERYPTPHRVVPGHGAAGPETAIYRHTLELLTRSQEARR